LYFSAALPAGASSGSTRCDRSVTAAVQAALKEARRSHMAIGPTTEAKRSRKGTGNETDLQTAAQEDLKSDLAYLQQQVHGLRSRFHGELGVLALRIEDNERRTMKRRKVARRWVMAAVVAVCLWLGSKGVRSMLNGPILLQGLDPPPFALHPRFRIIRPLPWQVVVAFQRVRWAPSALRTRARTTL
jgi:hypothetical protein